MSFVTVLEAVVTVAVMVAVPMATPVTSPALLTVAVLVLPEVHATWLVTTFWLLSAKVAVAVSCRVEPVVTVVLVADMSMLVRSEVLTMIPAVSSTPSWDAVMVALPAATAVTSPAATVAVVEEELLHFALLVTSLLSPLTVVPLAENCLVLPTVRKTEVGVRLIVLSELPETKKFPHPLVAKESRRIKRRTAVVPHFVLRTLPVRTIREFYQNRQPGSLQLSKEI